MDNDNQQDSIDRAAESKALESFLQYVNDVIRGSGSLNPMSEKTALKFLISRKFDTQRALQLYQMHEITRLQEGLISMDPHDFNLTAELDSGKFTILKHRDANGSTIALFTAKLHLPNKSAKNRALKRDNIRSTLQGIVYQLDAALENINTQRNGIVFIYNMSDSDYSNFDYELCQKILNLLKGAYPAKLKKVLIVSPPFWFRAPFHLLRLIVREKLRERVWLISIEQLSEHIPAHAITTDMGGAYEHDHKAWIRECHSLSKTRSDDFCDPTSGINLANSHNDLMPGIDFRRSSQENGTLEHDYASSDRVEQGAKRVKNGDSKSITHDYDDVGVPLSQFLRDIREKGVKGLNNEYISLARGASDGTFIASKSSKNTMKNRYINIDCYDHTRVVLQPFDLPDGTSMSDPHDYINASYVDGYRQARAYISTQGPMESTFMDFWRMIWQTNSRVIVMVTLNIENHVMKCDRYWPTSTDSSMAVGIFEIEFKEIEIHEDFIATRLILRNTKSNVERDIWHVQFISWPDFDTPQHAVELLKHREFVLKKQLDAIDQCGKTYPPIVVHCSAGVGRSGTFITIDICIQKLETTGLVDVKSVVEKLREQRFSSIQTSAQYIFCYKSVVEYAASCRLLDDDDLKVLKEITDWI